MGWQPTHWSRWAKFLPSFDPSFYPIPFLESGSKHSPEDMGLSHGSCRSSSFWQKCPSSLLKQKVSVSYKERGSAGSVTQEQGKNEWLNYNWNAEATLNRTQTNLLKPFICLHSLSKKTTVSAACSTANIKAWDCNIRSARVTVSTAWREV